MKSIKTKIIIDDTIVATIYSAFYSKVSLFKIETTTKVPNMSIKVKMANKNIKIFLCFNGS